jgi:hypothetical protein
MMGGIGRSSGRNGPRISRSEWMNGGAQVSPCYPRNSGLPLVSDIDLHIVDQPGLSKKHGQRDESWPL